ncbi:MAG TPA: sulfatase-like hydrolase/transferase [Phycisphaerae bacterium]|nr:sulfatase-like hydrolase/transferase [Phycisphaerae bacterium]
MVRREKNVPKTSSGKRGWYAVAVLIAAVAILAVAATWRRDVSQQGGPPPGAYNVILVTLDTTRADFLGCYGRTPSPTPTLDRLAREGVTFSRCESCATLTLPSHASIMTGKYPFAHGVRRNGTERLAAGNVTLAEHLQAHGYATSAVVASFVLNAQFGIGQGFDTYRDVQPADVQPGSNQERPGDAVCGDAVAQLQAHAGRPFFLWMHLYDAHFPYAARRDADEDERSAYADEIEYDDEQVRRLLAALDTLGLSDKTIVIVVGDHGEGLDDHAEPGHGFFVYESTARVPCIVRAPGLVASGQRVAERMRTVDVAPTVLDLLGLPPLPATNGRSLLPVMRGESREGVAAYCEALESHTVLNLCPLRSIVEDEWKYVLSTQPELYDLENDPTEQHNLVDEEPERAAELRSRLRALVAASPGAPSDDGPELSTDDLRRLQSLGYAATLGKDASAEGSELDHLEPQGPSPHQHAEEIRQYQLAVRAKMVGDYPRMETLLRQVRSQLPGAPHVEAELATSVAKQGRVAEAAGLYEEALQEVDKTGASMIRAAYGVLLMQMRRWDDAVTQLAQVVVDQPNDITSLHNLALAHAALGHFDDARQYMTQALGIDPNDTHLMRGMATICSWQGDVPAAIEWIKRALAREPNNAQLQNDLQGLQRRLSHS